MPATIDGLESVEPVYEMLPGWRTSTRGASSLEQLPTKARHYLTFLEEQSRRRSRLRLGGTGTQ